MPRTQPPNTVPTEIALDLDGIEDSDIRDSTMEKMIKYSDGIQDINIGDSTLEKIIKENHKLFERREEAKQRLKEQKRIVEELERRLEKKVEEVTRAALLRENMKQQRTAGL